MKENFNNRLITIRNAYGLSAYSFAKKLQLPQTSYLRYENGTRKPSADLIEKLIISCNINPLWLFKGEGEIFFNPNRNSGERQNDTTIEEKSSQFGSRLSIIQEKHNFLDREMAKLLDISEKEYMRLVLGSQSPDFEVLNRIKQNFNVSIDYLLYGEL